MADLQQTFDYLCPVNTGVGSPLIANAISAGPYRVVKVSVVIPDGHCGLTGIQLWSGGNASIPYESGWISGNNETYEYELSTRYPTGTPWQVAMVNSDIYQHHFQVRWEMNFVTARQARRYVRLGVGDVYAASDQLQTPVNA